jgi:UDP:flavonoid glycosyltransferase YjiC (YdhE family)
MKILFIPFTPSLAHITRCLSIADTMRADHHDCRFAVGIEGKDFITKAGYNVVIVPEIDSATFKTSNGWKWLTKKYFLDNLNAELKFIDEYNPDIIIYDFRFTSKLAAWIKSIKSYSIVHASALSLIIDRKNTVHKIIAGDNPTHKKNSKDRILGFIFPKVFKMFMSKPVKNIRSVLKQYDFRDIDVIFDLLNGDFILIADTIEFIPEGLKIPENARLVGPLTWTGWDNDKIFQLPGPAEKPIIYITMGSTVDAKPTILKLINSLKELPYTIIISTGQTEFDKNTVPDNVFLYSYVPGNFIASKSSLVIYHSGHETLMQTLSNGVPSLVIPVNPDQILVARQIRSLGIGNYLRHPKSFIQDKEPLKYFSTNEIKEEVLKMINDERYNLKCKALQKCLTKAIESKKYMEIITAEAQHIQ